MDAHWGHRRRRGWVGDALAEPETDLNREVCLNLLGWHSRCPRHQRFIVCTVAALLLYREAGFFILPPVLRTVAVKRLSKLLNRPVTIHELGLNPFWFSATIRGLLVTDRVRAWNRSPGPTTAGSLPAGNEPPVPPHFPRYFDGLRIRSRRSTSNSAFAVSRRRS